MPLTFAPAGGNNIIVKITGNDEMRRHLAELGFVMGERVSVINELGGNMIINVKGSRIALGKSMASRIMVADC